MDGWHDTEIRVRYAETDKMGIVHHSNYLIWFELARIDYLERHAGGYQRLRDEGIEALVLDMQNHAWHRVALVDDEYDPHLFKPAREARH